MINRIHGDAPDLGPSAQPSFAAGFTQIDILMGDIAQLADRSLAIHQNHPNLA
jgi:hypothetical protein